MAVAWAGPFGGKTAWPKRPLRFPANNHVSQLEWMEKHRTNNHVSQLEWMRRSNSEINVGWGCVGRNVGSETGLQVGKFRRQLLPTRITSLLSLPS